MFNIFIDKPELLFFSTVFVGMFIYGFFKNYVYCTRVTELSNRLIVLTPSIKGNFIDIHSSKKQSNSNNKYGTLSLIADEFSKGYDFIVVEEQVKEIKTPVHKHKRTNELIYMLSGKIKVSRLNKEDDYEIEDILSPGNWIFIESGTEHYIKIIEPAKYIIVAKPPLFSRIGKFYEFLFKKTNKQK